MARHGTSLRVNVRPFCPMMGIVIDSNRMVARLAEDKLARIKQLLDSFTNRRSAHLVDLQSLIGTLQFACKVVVPGRTFLQRIINLTRGVLNRFHHIRLNKEFSRDITMWKAFLTKWNGRSFSLESFVTTSPYLELYTDAASTVGFGGYLNGKWFQGRWPPHCSLTSARVLVSNGKNFFLLSSLARSGILIFVANAFNFGATMRALLLSLTQATLKPPGSWSRSVSYC